MAKNKPNLKGTPERSPKAHEAMPPKEIEPGADSQRGHRGEVGQFTDQGAPGLQTR